MTEKIKVCFVQAYGYAVFNPLSKAKIGGAEVDLYNIATELAKDKRFDVYFLVADFGQKDLEEYKKVKVIKSHSQTKTLKNYVFSLVNFYRRIFQIDADIYLTANLSKYVGLTNLYCLLFKKIHIHRTEHQDQVNKKIILKNIAKGKVKYLTFLLGFINVDHIIVQNEEDQITLKKTFNFPSTVIKNSYFIEQKPNNKKDIILWVARGEKWKRPESFIKLAGAFPTYNFVMIMPIGSDRQYFYRIKEDAKNYENLKFIPGVPFSEVEVYYKRAQVFVNTSLSEGFPNSFNQAMNSGTPLLSLKINPDDFIQKNQVGIYCHDDFDGLKKGLSILLRDNVQWNKFSQNAYAYVRKEMNIEIAIMIWKKIFLYFLRKYNI